MYVFPLSTFGSVVYGGIAQRRNIRSPVNIPTHVWIRNPSLKRTTTATAKKQHTLPRDYFGQIHFMQRPEKSDYYGAKDANDELLPPRDAQLIAPLRMCDPVLPPTLSPLPPRLDDLHIPGQSTRRGDGKFMVCDQFCCAKPSA